ncbi:hypothetical protein WA158_003998 [Blastocystis sp. Blastoise]
MRRYKLCILLLFLLAIPIVAKKSPSGRTKNNNLNKERSAVKRNSNGDSSDSTQNSQETNSFNNDVDYNMKNDNSLFSKMGESYVSSTQASGENMESIFIQPNQFDFNERFICVVFQESIEITNPSSIPVVISSASSDTPAFSFLLPYPSVTIYPSQTVSITIGFIPTGLGETKGKITIYTSIGTFNYDVQGIGIENPYGLSPLSLQDLVYGRDEYQFINMTNAASDTKKTRKLIIHDVFIVGDLVTITLPHITDEDSHGKTLLSSKKNNDRISWILSRDNYLTLCQLHIHTNKIGEHTSYLHIYTSVYHFVVPISFSIINRGLQLSPSHYVNQGLFKNIPHTVSISVYNTHLSPLSLQFLYIAGVHIHRKSLNITYTLNTTLIPPKGNVEKAVELTFTPREEGIFTGSIIVYTNSTDINMKKMIFTYNITCLTGEFVIRDAFIPLHLAYPASFVTEQVPISMSNQYPADVMLYDIYVHDDVRDSIKINIREKGELLDITDYLRSHGNVTIKGRSTFDDVIITYSTNRYPVKMNHMIYFKTSLGTIQRLVYVYDNSLSIFIVRTVFPNLKQVYDSLPPPLPSLYYNPKYMEQITTYISTSLSLSFGQIATDNQRFIRITIYNQNPISIPLSIYPPSSPYFSLHTLSPISSFDSDKYPMPRTTINATFDFIHSSNRYLISPGEYFQFALALSVPPREIIIPGATGDVRGVCGEFMYRNIFAIRTNSQHIMFDASFELNCGTVSFSLATTYLIPYFMDSISSDIIQYTSTYDNTTEIYSVTSSSSSLTYHLYTNSIKKAAVNENFIKFTYHIQDSCLSPSPANPSCYLLPSRPSPYDVNNSLQEETSSSEIIRYIYKEMAWEMVKNQQGVLDYIDVIINTGINSHIHYPLYITPIRVSILPNKLYQRGILPPIYFRDVPVGTTATFTLNLENYLDISVNFRVEIDQDIDRYSLLYTNITHSEYSYIDALKDDIFINKET